MLQYLCRCGMEAVQTTFELEVITTEYQEDPNLAHAESGAGGVMPANVHSVVKGKLHLRMANLGHPVDPKATTTGNVYLWRLHFCVMVKISTLDIIGYS